MKGSVVAICISQTAGGKMQQVNEVRAIAGSGLLGDRYCYGKGSFNKKNPGTRQVTLMNSIFFANTNFQYFESRRNIFTKDVELMWLIGREFKIGTSTFKGVKYCDPCNRPSKLSSHWESFQEIFFDRGGLVAEVLENGVIRVGDTVIPPPKGY